MNKYLIVGGILTAIAALLHLGIIVGGANWYRFFGAGEKMAQMAEAGALEPAIITFFIFLLLATMSVYAFAGTQLMPALPLQKFVLTVGAVGFILRGLFGLPMVYLNDHPYMLELRLKPIFMIVTSVVVTGIGVLYFLGIRTLSSSNQ